MKTFFKNARIVDGTGKKAIENGLLVMKHDMNNVCPDVVEYVGSMKNYDLHEKISESDKVLDVSGYTILPGLFNTHVHLDLNLPYSPIKFDEYGPPYRSLVSYRRAAEALMCGVTTVRSVGTSNGADHAVKKAIDNHMLWGPRILSSGSLLIAHGGHGHNSMASKECSGIAEFRKAARKEIKDGADVIKVCMTGGLASPSEEVQDKQMSDDEVSAVVEVAHGAGKKVAAHLGGDQAIQDAIRLGVDSVEHGYNMSEETVNMMVEQGTFLVPTISVSHANEYLKKHGSPSYQLEKQVLAQKEHNESLKRAIKAGVKISCGTDLLPSDPLDGTNATVREIELLTEAGMSPLEAIKAATYNSAELCGVLDKTGTLEAGKEGDFIVCKGAPDNDISDLRNIELVAKGCRLVFSDIPAMKVEPFNILGPGYEMVGGTFKKW